ncbi:MAG: DNA-binding protein [Bacteroidetes bacterium RIFOXYB2_FULL_35_7]|nr:MAG: DNA-binding protein [Bacteroidetes bacterium GWF2_35_48]OFY93939.1 MAG: DNA-binding protein [Bacteroidetes bacterium RIFOXYC12_FULL_35_7]OFY97838.1 MAG: DNA-binding protein [Bacteroidetes bacterium RIFOXYB2_FULL_35_7]HBX53552.1 DNA-binding protein [Bacteroidales bacterium]
MKEESDSNHGEIILYQASDNKTALEVRFEEETVWLTQAQIAELFGTKRPAITKHLINIYKSGELIENSTCSILEHMGITGVQKYQTQYYNLDAILSVGYRVNSKNATQFRIWANGILKSYLLKGYAIRQQFEHIEKKLHQHDKTLFEHEQKIGLIIKTALPPHEGIFFDGQIFDAYAFVSKIIKSAKKSIILIDNYIDESVLTLLSKRSKNVTATIYTTNISKQLHLDLLRFNAQYSTLEIKTFSKSHDRFLIIDEKIIYHIGASLKDLGKKWFAFSKIELDVKEIMAKLEK